MDNFLSIKISAKDENVKFIRSMVASFVSNLNPNVDVLLDIKTAISEAVTNCIVHGYKHQQDKYIYIEVLIEGRLVKFKIQDYGIGIDNVDKALEPFYSTEGDLRSGMGFTLMSSFMDKLDVISKPNDGTTVYMEKYFVEDENA